MDELKPGMRVLHSLFGSGTIRAISGSGPGARLTIDFGANVGQKKLQAGVAHLKVPGEETTSAPDPAAWYEKCNASFKPAPGRHPPLQKVHASLRGALRTPEFWLALRERLRASGSTPKVLDEISGNAALSLSGLLQLSVCVRHGELLKQNEIRLTHSIVELLQARYLQDFAFVAGAVGFSAQGELPADDIVIVGEAPLSELPDRAPRRSPVRVLPKGVIRARPRGLEDY